MTNFQEWQACYEAERAAHAETRRRLENTEKWAQHNMEAQVLMHLDFASRDDCGHSKRWEYLKGEDDVPTCMACESDNRRAERDHLKALLRDTLRVIHDDETEGIHDTCLIGNPQFCLACDFKKSIVQRARAALDDKGGDASDAAAAVPPVHRSETTP